MVVPSWKEVLLSFRAMALWLVAVASLSGQELMFLKGTTRSLQTHDSTFAWMLEYQQGINEHQAFSFAYVNEGHLPFHHRDGNAAQLWERAILLDGRLALAGGLGAYYFYDTAGISGTDGYLNRHGFGAIGSLAATWYFPNRVLAQARANWISIAGHRNNFSALFGIGYQLSAPESPGPRSRPPFQPDWTTDKEIVVHVGSTIVNSFHSELSPAIGLEFRQGLGRYTDLSATWLYEGRNQVIRRNGLAVELWKVRTFFSDHLALGAGAGAYLNIDYRRQPREDEQGSGHLDGIVSLRIAGRWGKHWEAPITWHRIVTGYNRDTDLFMFGLGYRY
jgi:hypothetical protein